MEQMTLGQAIDHLIWMASYEQHRASNRATTIEALKLIVALFPETRPTLVLLWKALEGVEIVEEHKGYSCHVNEPVALCHRLERGVGLAGRYGHPTPAQREKLDALLALTI